MAVTFLKLNIFVFVFFLTTSIYPETFKNEVDLPKCYLWEGGGGGSPTPFKTKKSSKSGILYFGVFLVSVGLVIAKMYFS